MCFHLYTFYVSTQNNVFVPFLSFFLFFFVRVKSSEPSKVVIHGSSSSGQAKSSAVIRAQEVRSNLEAEFPSFVKSLVRSHVASCFWMVSSLRVDEFLTIMLVV